MKCRIVGIRPPAKYAGTWDEQAALLMGGVLAENRNIMLMLVSDIRDLNVLETVHMDNV